jgi:hypothetical protein
MTCYQKGAMVWDTGMRRVGKIKGLSRSGSLHDHVLYEVESRATKDDCAHGSEATCCELRSLDEKTEEGRHNLRVVAQIEKLMRELR